VNVIAQYCERNVTHSCAVTFVLKLLRSAARLCQMVYLLVKLIMNEVALSLTLHVHHGLLFDFPLRRAM
jgi:hypothetical protein